MKNKVSLEKVMKFISTAILSIIVLLLLYWVLNSCVSVIKMNNRINDLNERVNKLELEVKAIENDNAELWKNIDALSEDYCTLWIQLYGEESWK